MTNQTTRIRLLCGHQRGIPLALIQYGMVSAVFCTRCEKWSPVSLPIAKATVPLPKDETLF